MKKLAFLLTTCALMACESDGLLIIKPTEQKVIIEHQPTSELESLLPKTTCCGPIECCCVACQKLQPECCVAGLVAAPQMLVALVVCFGLLG